MKDEKIGLSKKGIISLVIISCLLSTVLIASALLYTELSDEQLYETLSDMQQDLMEQAEQSAFTPVQYVTPTPTTIPRRGGGGGKSVVTTPTPTPDPTPISTPTFTPAPTPEPTFPAEPTLPEPITEETKGKRNIYIIVGVVALIVALLAIFMYLRYREE